MFRIYAYPLGVFQTNGYVVIDEESGKGLVIDPGYEPKEVVERIQSCEVVAVLLTHGHLDHIAGLKEIRAQTNAPIYIHEKVADWLTDPELNRSAMMPQLGDPIVGPAADRLITGDGEIDLSPFRVRVLCTPGHTPGCVSFLLEQVLFSGDCLFCESVGRTDLPGADFATLENSIRQQLYTLPEPTLVLPGHGRQTTIGHEKLHNPFVTV